MSMTRAARPPVRLVGLIAVITVVPLGTLLWLGWRLLDQDRVLERQQIQQRVERGADRLVVALQRAIGATEQRLTAGLADWPDGAVAVVLRNESVEVFPRGRVAYVPRVAAGREAPPAAFASGEDLEFRQHDVDGAVRAFRALASSPDPAVRAGGLLRLARTLQNSGRADEALDAYARLAAIDDMTLGGVPAGLIGRYGRCRLLEKMNRGSDLRVAAGNLETELTAGRWPLTEPVYSLYSADARRWSGRPSPAPQSELFAEAITVISERGGSVASPPARESIEAHGQRFVVLWQKTNGSTRALVVSPSFVESQWLPSLAPIARESAVVFGLRDAAAGTLFGRVQDVAGDKVTRTATESALPFTLVAASVEPPSEARDFAARRRFLVAGLLLLVLMAGAAGYLIVRAVSREMAVARLQSDFVSAVSHEFRTPLTSLRQFTDMLRESPALGDDRRRLAYDAQARATDRLTRLVESLLDFGRMQAGARHYRFEPYDCTELVRSTVDDFRGEAAAAGHAIHFRGNGAMPIDVDHEALSRAVRNLLDNAVKYSPDPQPIDVAVGRRDADVVISVMDRGIGIPPQERASIFSKFQRGEQARAAGIKGTGIGLAMVDEIVRAHRGRVEVASEVGRGSTFTIVLPGEPPA